MSEVRTKLARDLARSIIKGINFSNPPVVLNQVVKYMRTTMSLNIRKQDLGDGFDGVSAETHEEAFLQYNSNVHYHRARATVSHELGHISLHHTHPANLDRLDATEKQRENEAWCFGRELLMPLPMFRKDVKNVKSIPELSKRYWVSEDIVRVRIQELHLETSILDWGKASMNLPGVY